MTATIQVKKVERALGSKIRVIERNDDISSTAIISNNAGSD